MMQLIKFVGGELNVGEVAVFAGPNYVLSVRRGSKQHFLGEQERDPQIGGHGVEGQRSVHLGRVGAFVDAATAGVGQLVADVRVLPVTNPLQAPGIVWHIGTRARRASRSALR